MIQLARRGGAIVLGLLPIALVVLVAPWLRVRVLVAIAIAYATATSAILLASGGAPFECVRPWRRAVSVGAVGLIAMGAGLAIARAAHGRSWVDIVAALVGTLGVLSVGTTVGASVGLRVQHPSHLLAVALASSAADIWSVASPEGVTRAVVTSRDVAFVRMFTVSSPIVPSRIPDAVIGLGDVIFVALYLAVAERHALRRSRTLMALAAGLVAAGATAVALAKPLPALPFLGVAIVAATPTAWKVPRQDRLATTMAGALLVAAIVRVLVLKLR